MEYPKNFDPHIDKHVLAAATGVEPNTAKLELQKINDDLEKQGFRVFRGCAPISEILKRVKTNRETLIYFWEKLGCGVTDKEKGTSDN